ncbi:hypothetical protein EOM86_08720, partial [Candidatus Nomurabacteria bacterium]|nr:hypothetical protein [Candidatus Nomurabacteria bacterium]
DLKCEYLKDPIGIDDISPRLMWKCVSEEGTEQEAFRIKVYSDDGSDDEVCIWDSGEVESTCNYCDYTGPELQSAGKYTWLVEVRDNKADWTRSLGYGHFEMGLLSTSDWMGRWIGTPTPGRGVYLFRKSININAGIEKARAYIATAGYSELWINGIKVGDSILDPANTDYAKRVLYVSHDVTGYINEGENVIGIKLNNGWSSHAAFLLQMNITLDSGEILSCFSEFGSWVMMVSATTSATIYSGAVKKNEYKKNGWIMSDKDFYDIYHKEDWRVFCDELPAYREHNPHHFDQYSTAYYDVLELASPGGILKAQKIQPIRKVGTIKPVYLDSPSEGKHVYDFAQNFTGWAKIDLTGQRGTVVTVKHSEITDDHGDLNMDYLRISDPSYPLPMQTDTYFLSESGQQICEPEFTYHGFRYMSIEGLPDPVPENDIVGIVIHSDVRQTGYFSTDHDMLNKLQELIIWTEKSNLFSIPTDCPQRSERQGWLNDLTARAEEAVYNFGLELFFTKFSDDMTDTQDHFSGAIADTAPYRRGNRPADPVSSSFIIIPYLLYMHYGDIRPARDKYNNLAGWAEYLFRNSNDGIMSYSVYGDWASPADYCIHNGMQSPVSSITPGTFVSSGYLYYNFKLLRDIAQALEYNNDVSKYSDRLERIRTKLNSVYFDPETANYSTGSQGCNIFALYLGIVPEGYCDKVVRNVISDIEDKGYHITT